MICLVAFDQILRPFFGGVDRVALEIDFGGDLFEDRASHSTCFRIPFDVISDLELARHRNDLLEKLPINSRLCLKQQSLFMDSGTPARLPLPPDGPLRPARRAACGSTPTPRK